MIAERDGVVLRQACEEDLAAIVALALGALVFRSVDDRIASEA